MLVNRNINTMNGGVSQQPEELRFDNQVESMENFMVTVSQGLRRRNPLELLSTFNGTFSDNIKTHSYDRGDDKEKYAMFLDDNGIHIFDEEGNEKTVVVVDDNPLVDWIGTNWRRDVEFLTVGDTTWLLNKSIKVEMKEDKTETLFNRNNAFYWLKRSFNDGQDKGYTYYLTINGITFSDNSIDTDSSSKSLSDKLNQRYTTVDNDPSIFPDYIRAVNFGSIVHVYVAEIYAPDFRVHTGTTNRFVRVEDSDGNIVGLDVENYETSFNLINNNFKLYCEIDGVSDFYNLKDETPTEFTVYYYSNSTQAVSDSSPDLSTMNLYSTDGTEDFTFEFSDSWGDQASFGWKDSVSKISDLPASMKGFSENDVGTIAITGTDRDNFNNYYLKWKNGEYWGETTKEGIEYIIDYKTLPAKIVRQANGTFAFGYNNPNDDYDGFTHKWIERRVGDDDSNPIPSFIGNTISNMFFFKNRLCFTSEENVILSEAGGFYNFFATTVMEILDSDPIDAGVDSNTVSIIRAVNATAGAVTLWSDTGQFLLAGGDVLSPATTRIAQTSSYQSTNDIKPLAIDNEIIFFNKVGRNLTAMTYSPASIQSDKSTGRSISSHVPSYIPSTANGAYVSSAHNMIFITDKIDKNTIYIYKYFIKSQERAISSWFKWILPIEIKGIMIIENDLIILGDDNKITKLELEPKNISDSFLDFGDTSFTSKVVMSKFNIETNQGSKIIREPFYIKNIKINTYGKTDLDIINSERTKTKLINTKHLERKIVIGGNSEKINIGFSTSYDTGVQIDTVNIEGRVKTKSRNI